MSEQMQKALVIGGAGFIGSNLVRYLISQGNDVSVMHRGNSNLDRLKGISFASVIADITDSTEAERVLYSTISRCNVVYNLAVCASSLKKHYSLSEAVNVQGAQLVAKVARKCGVKLIHVSSSTAIGYPEKNEVADETFVFNANYDHYADTKHRAEKLILKEVEKGLNAVIANPCSTVGAYGMKAEQFNTFKGICYGSMKIYPPGGLCITYIDDLVKGLVLCFEKGQVGKRYILGGTNISYKQYFNEIASSTGGTAPIICLPKTILPFVGSCLEFVSKIFNKDISINKNVCQMISNDLFYSSALAIKELGYKITDWQEAIKQTTSKLVF